MKLGRLTLLHPIGHGGMAAVWRASIPGYDADVAVKLLSRDAAARALPGGVDATSAFLAEARAVAALQHPNVVAVHELGVVGPEEAAASGGQLWAGCPWLAMELLLGGTLNARPCPDWPTARAWLAAVLEALAHAHARGVVHRDIKRENVLFDAAGRLRLVDFGVALEPERAAEEAPFVGGTPAAMAPEQFSPDWRRQGPWSDLYAVGVLGWDLVTGRFPFEASDIRGWLSAHRSEAPPALAPRFPVPEGLDAWLRWLLAKRPGDRPGSAAEALRSLPSEGAASTPASWPPPMPSPSAVTLWGETTWVVDEAAPIELTENPAPRFERPAGATPEDWRQPEWVGARLGAASLFRLRQPPLVGRERLQDALWERLRQLDRSRCVLLSGPMGIGRTALARWLLHRVSELDCAGSAEARHSAGGGPDDGLVGLLARALRADGLEGEALRARLRVARADGETREDVDDLYAALTRRSAVDLRVALTARFLGELRGSGRRGERPPVVLLLDDLHLGAEARRLARHLLEDRRSRVLIVATVGADASPAAAEELAALAEHPRCEPIALKPLDRGHCERLLRSQLHLDPQLAARLVGRVSGNPRFALDLARRWVEEDALELGPAGYVLRDEAALDALPAELSALSLGRLLPLLSDPVERHAYELAAALGERVDRAEWARACAQAELAPSWETWAGLLAAGLVAPEGQGSWRWTQPLLREALLQEAADDLPALHAACVDAIEVRGPAGALRRAHHMLHARRPAEALPLLLDLPNHHLYGGDRAGALALCDDIEAALTALGAAEDDPRWGRALCVRARAARIGHDVDEALRLARLAEARAGGDEGVIASARSVQAQALIDLYRFDEVIALAEGSDAPVLRGLRAMALAKSGRLDEAEEAVSELTGTTFLAPFLRGMIALERLELDAAEGALREAIAAAEAAPSPLNLASFRVNLGQCLREAGRLEEAYEHTRFGLVELSRQGSPWLREARREMITLQALHRSPRRARGLAVAMLEEHETFSRLDQNTVARAGLACVAALEGDHALLDELLAVPLPEIPFTRAFKRDIARLYRRAAGALEEGARRSACLDRARRFEGG